MGGPPSPPAGGPPEMGGPPPGGPEGLPESKNKLENLLLETDDDMYITNSSLGDMEKELLKILKD
jgi:hypothetical protein